MTSTDKKDVEMTDGRHDVETVEGADVMEIDTATFADRGSHLAPRATPADYFESTPTVTTSAFTPVPSTVSAFAAGTSANTVSAFAPSAPAPQPQPQPTFPSPNRPALTSAFDNFPYRSGIAGQARDVLPTPAENAAPVEAWAPNNADVSASYNPDARFQLDLSQMTDGSELADDVNMGAEGSSASQPAPASLPSDIPSTATQARLELVTTPPAEVSLPQTEITSSTQLPLAPPSPPQVQSQPDPSHPLFDFCNPNHVFRGPQAVSLTAPEDLERQRQRAYALAEEGSYDALIFCAQDDGAFQPVLQALLTISRPEEEVLDALRLFLAHQSSTMVLNAVVEAGIEGNERAGRFLYRLIANGEDVDPPFGLVVFSIVMLDMRCPRARQVDVLIKLIRSPGVFHLIALARGEWYGDDAPAVDIPARAAKLAAAWLDELRDYLFGYLIDAANDGVDAKGKGKAKAASEPTISARDAVNALAALTALGTTFQRVWGDLEYLARSGVTAALEALVQLGMEDNAVGTRARARLRSLVTGGSLLAFSALLSLIEAGAPSAVLDDVSLTPPMRREMFERAQAGSATAWRLLVPIALSGPAAERTALIATASSGDAGAQTALAHAAFPPDAAGYAGNETTRLAIPALLDVARTGLSTAAFERVAAAARDNSREAARILARLADDGNMAALRVLKDIADDGGVHARGFLVAMFRDPSPSLSSASSPVSVPAPTDAPSPTPAVAAPIPRRRAQAAPFLGQRQAPAPGGFPTSPPPAPSQSGGRSSPKRTAEDDVVPVNAARASDHEEDEDDIDDLLGGSAQPRTSTRPRAQSTPTRATRAGRHARRGSTWGSSGGNGGGGAGGSGTGGSGAGGSGAGGFTFTFQA